LANCIWNPAAASVRSVLWASDSWIAVQPLKVNSAEIARAPPVAMMLVLPKPLLYAFILGPMLLVDETGIPRREGNRRGDGEPLSATTKTTVL
jgi:hypothetical protein